MKFGYECVKPMCDELLAFMEKHKFETLADFKGHSLEYFTTHADSCRRQAERKAAQKAAADAAKKMVAADGEWSGDEFVKQSDALAAKSDSAMSQCIASHLLPSNFIGGEWRTPDRGVATRRSSIPRTARSSPSVPSCSAGGCRTRRCEAAAAAFPAWRDTPAVERARVFFRYRQLIEENFDRICASISREHGKTLVEARGSVYRGIENIEYACGMPSLLMGDTLENIARGVDCETMLPTARRLRRHHAVQFSRDGAAVDVPDRARLREHVRAQAEREGSADGGAASSSCWKKPACPKAC